MIHLGDITKLRGSEVPIVDVVTGGSPCQNFSVAGNRKGLGGDESVLFYHQIRLVKEMREHDRNNGRAEMYVRPRYCIWENVPGAFSSNGGKDFQAVLTEFVRVADPEAPDVPMPDKGKWPKSGCLYDELGRWSISYKVHNSQHWGVPQRRKRICVLCDFNGLSAAEILFDPQFGGTSQRADAEQAITDTGAEPGRKVQSFSQGLSGDFEPGSETREGSPPTTGDCVESAIGVDVYNQEITGDVAASLTAACGGSNTSGPKALSFQGREVCYGISSYDSNAMKSPNPHSGIYEADTSRTLDLNGGNPACNQGGMAVLCLNDQGGSVMNVSEDVSGALRAQEHGHQPIVAGFKGGAGVEAGTIGYEVEKSPTLLAGMIPNVLAKLDAMGFDAYQDMLVNPFAASGFAKYEQGVGTLRASGGDYGGGTETLVANNIVRRLTPVECERLQGFPDDWTDIGDWTDSKGKLHKAADSPRYKALGNSIALPFWQYLARRICAQYERSITMASLFDGIGGFPLVFERCGAKAVWASEIEEFPMAVTKIRFKEE